MRFAKIVFTIAGVWGFLILIPLYFMYDTIGRTDPPPITHPGFYFGFLGITLAWQVAFLIIARDPVRFRPIMIAAILEKVAYIIGMAVLLLAQWVKPSETVSAIPDTILAVLFAMAYVRTKAS